MPKDVLYGKTLRKSFARTQEIMEMPNLLEIQKSSYKWFLETGLREVFKDVDSVTDYSGNLELSFIDYSMNEKPKYTEEECKARDATYAAPLKVRVRLRNKETEEIKEQEIFMGDFPLMTPGGTFVINGAERVIVSQIVRSPGVYFDRTTDKAMITSYASTIIPYHGAWLEYETDANDIFSVRIDKNRKLPITWFLKAMGAYDENRPATWLSCVADPYVGATTNERIKEIFGEDERMVATIDKDTTTSRDECLLEIYRKLRPGDPPTVESAETLLDGLFFDRRRMALSETERLGAEAVALTHGSPLAFLTGAMLTHIISLCLRHPDVPLKALVKHAMAGLREQFGHQYSQVFEICAAVRSAIAYAESPDLNWQEVMERIECYDSAQVLAGAVYACLASGEDFDRAMILAVNHSGRSAAVGAITGASLGARMGEEALPEFYIECLEPGEVLRELADDLYHGCTMEKGSRLFDLDWDRKYLHGGR